MEQLDISLNKGVRRAPSFAENGELSECVNLYPKNGELRNIPVMETLKDGLGSSDFILPEGCRLIAVHAVDGLKIYISRKTIGGSTPVTALYFSVWEKDQAETSDVISLFTTDESVKILTLGRIMMAIDTSGLHYFIWKNDTYTYLGDKIPDLPISFGLRGCMEAIPIDVDVVTSHLSLPVEDDTTPIEAADSTGEAMLKRLSELLYGKAAETTAQAARDGKFTHSFFVRYGIRLYDGTYANISAPVLMLVSTNELFTAKATWRDPTQTNIYSGMVKASLDYYIKNGVLSQFEDWNDIVKGVDIFVSAPIYTYNPNSNNLYGIFIHDGETFSEGNGYFLDSLTERFVMVPTSSEGTDDRSVFAGYGFSVCRLSDPELSNTDWSDFYAAKDNYMKRDMALMFCLKFPKGQYKMSNLAAWEGVFRLERRSKEAVIADYRGDGPYYLLKSYNLSDLQDDETNSGARHLVEVDGTRLSNLTTQTILKETENITSIKSISDAIIYNKRLNLTGVKVEVDCKQDLSSLLPFANGYQTWKLLYRASPSYPEQLGADIGEQIAWHLSIEVISPTGNTFIMRDTSLAPEGSRMNLPSALIGFLYADGRARRAVIYNDTSSGGVIIHKGVTFTLEENDLINAAHYLGQVISYASLEMEVNVPTPTIGNYITYHNTLYQSEVENPFVYKAANEINIGSGEILRLASLTEPLSTGQFGQFPLVAFCSDGMWALEIYDNGTLRTPRPLSPDVLSNLESVTAVEGGILYITKQGLKFLSRDKQIRLLSKTVEGKNIDEDVYVGISTPIRSYVSAWADLFLPDTEEVREALQTAKIAYDAKNNLIHLYFTALAKHMVLSLEGYEFVSQVNASGMTTMPEVVQDYSGNVLQFTGRKLYIFDAQPRETKDYGFCISRILTFGQAEQYANIMQMKVYHDADTITGSSDSTPSASAIKTALYASNDKLNWALLTSLKGASYKFYRFGLFTYMNDLEAVSGLSFTYNLARTNKLR